MSGAEMSKMDAKVNQVNQSKWIFVYVSNELWPIPRRRQQVMAGQLWGII